MKRNSFGSFQTIIRICFSLLTLIIVSFARYSSAQTEAAAAFQAPPISSDSCCPETITSTSLPMRAWTCHGRNQRDMVSRLRQAGIIQSDAVAAVMEVVDRRHYVPDETVAYQDTPLSIGLGQTISAPHMHAHVLQEIYPYVQNKPNVKFLDVGCGSGYLTACFARWIKPKPSIPSSSGGTSILGATSGRVYGIDIHRHLVDMTKANMQKSDSDLLDITELSVANGWHGLPEAAPFDAIHVGAAAAEFPQELATQLKKDGVLIVPVGPQYAAQSLIKVQRIDDRLGNRFDSSEYKFTELLGVRYVPLVDTNPPTS